MIDASQEKEFLESVIDTYVTSETPQNRLIKRLAVRTFSPYITRKGNILEIGCCDGFMTALIAPLCRQLTVIDGSKSFIEIARKKVSSNIEFVYTLLEEYAPNIKFDYIFATYILEHVKDAEYFLKLAGKLLTENGLLFIVVPNAKALSRQLARHMGIIKDLYDLTQNDINHGHRRVYDRVLLSRDIEAAGLKQVSQGGLLLKLLADFQMDTLIESEILGGPQLEGLYKMGLEYPDLAGSLFSVVSLP